MKKHYFVDLFAGCGGLSLGLENAGFSPAYVNELDGDAMESYLINRDNRHPMLREKYHSHDVRQLSEKKNALEKLASNFEEDYGIRKGDLDLVVGGPPCQGYSTMGHRRTFWVEKKSIPSNHLYKDMIKVIRVLKPKCFLFENVGGMMLGRWTRGGNQGEIWSDVKKSFESLGKYVIAHALVHAKSYGVPQNRPRIFLVGVRRDFTPEENGELPANGFLPKPTNNYHDPVDLLSDLVDSNYLTKDFTNTYIRDPQNEIQKRLRTTPEGNVLNKGDELTDQEYSKHSERIRNKFQYMIDHNGNIPEHMRTKKFAQRIIPKRWGETGPNITIMSLPDDYVHYCQPRILTVREWARLQTFPDWYKFAGKRTTGGRYRAGVPYDGMWKRETPKYTQIGNAVPVKLAEAIGKHLKRIIA